jgi:hypothetical protein
MPLIAEDPSVYFSPLGYWRPATTEIVTNRIL